MIDREQLHLREIARLDAALAEARAEIARLRIDNDSWANSDFERQLAEARAEGDRLRECLVVADADRIPLAMDVEILREQLARMRPVYEAAVAWHRVNTGMHTNGAQHMRAMQDVRTALVAAIDAAKEQG